MRAILLTLALYSCTRISAQDAVVSSERQASKVYLGIDNPINVFVEGSYCSSLSVATDNGTVEKIGCRYVYRPSRLGPAFFALSIKKNGKTLELQKRQLYVYPIPGPIAEVGDFSNGSEVRKGAFCAQMGVGAYIKNLGIDVD